MILAIATAFIAGSIATGTIAFADDEDELSELACEAGKAMTGILLEDDDEITDILCGAQLQGAISLDVIEVKNALLLYLYILFKIFNVGLKI